MIEILVTIAGLSFRNAEVAEVIAPAREVWAGTVIFGELTTSDCLDWQYPTCFDSEIVLALNLNRQYDIRILEEPDDRNEPNRAEIALTWTYHPADLNLDGVLTSEDLFYYYSNEYDYNLDGFINSMDVVDLIQAFQIPQGRKFQRIDGPVPCC